MPRRTHTERLIIEQRDPAQVPAVVLCKLSENSAKADRVLGCFSSIGEADGGAAGQDVYAPPNVSPKKKAMLAKHVCSIFTLFWGVTNKKRSVAVGTYARNVGVAWWARAWELGSFRQLATRRASSFERRIELLKAAMPRWGLCNAFVFRPELLDDDASDLLLMRFKGEDAMSLLVDRALGANVADAPR